MAPFQYTNVIEAYNTIQKRARREKERIPDANGTAYTPGG
jgi:hypothetical protein